MTTIEPITGTVSLIVVSDFVCPWCYIGSVAIEQMQREYDVTVRYGPYLLDPSTPPEGKPRKPQTRPEDPPTQIEARAAELGLTFTRGRTWSSNTLLAHEAAEYAAETPHAFAFHKAMFKAYFEDLADIGKVETVLRIADSVGLDTKELAEVLESRALRQQVLDGIQWARDAGISGVPTTIFEDKWAIPGAQDYEVYESIMTKLGQTPKR